MEEYNHIFFNFTLAKLMWVGVRKLLHMPISQGLFGVYRRLVGVPFATLLLGSLKHCEQTNH
jgi:hypothetical protein